VAIAGIVGADFWLNAREEIYATQIGQVREVVLSDSSVITLNTNSKVTVRFTRDLRDIHLLQGEALFDVAKNKKRPFIVHVGDMLVRAVGTSFTVSLLPQKPIQVLVKEGVVELNRANKSKAVPVRANANMQVFAMQNAPIVAARVPQAQIQRDLAWQFGQIALDNQSLKDAATEFARYSDVRIDVAPTVANRTVTGLFISNDPVGFAKAAAAVLKLKVEVNDRVVKLSD
jgi:transmembrane sensor